MSAVYIGSKCPLWYVLIYERWFVVVSRIQETRFILFEWTVTIERRYIMLKLLQIVQNARTGDSIPNRLLQTTAHLSVCDNLGVSLHWHFASLTVYVQNIKYTDKWTAWKHLRYLLHSSVQSSGLWYLKTYPNQSNQKGIKADK